MGKKEIAKILYEISVLYELKGENFFKIRAYQMAARALEVSTIEINKETEIEDIKKINGIGSGIASQVKELAETDRLKAYEEIKESIPAGLVEMLKIPGLGPRKIKYLYDTLTVCGPSELEYACHENKLLNLQGFGKKTQDNILHGIELLKKFRERFLYPDAVREAEILESNLRKLTNIRAVSIAGSLRRKKETVKDIDLVAAADTAEEAENIMDFFICLPETLEVIARGQTKSSIRLKSGINADLRIVRTAQFPFALHHFTGSSEHNTAMRSYAKKHDIKINEYGLFKTGSDGNEKAVTGFEFKDEKDIFSFFNMQYIEPELRENTGEIEAALERNLPDLIEEKDLKGVFHFHTNNSDGNFTIEQAAVKLKSMGYGYCGIADHSKTARYAGGISNDGLKQYFDEIEQVNEKIADFKIFIGIESEILPDGSLDYDDSILEKFDFVIIAVHSGFNMSSDKMTRRIVKAMQNRHSTFLAHPTGRLLLARDPYKVNIREIIDSASEYDVDLEINASPFRLDLDWLNCKYARGKNVKFFICPDAHDLEGFYDCKYGIGVARKGWLEKRDVTNCMTKTEMEIYLTEKKIRKKKNSLN